MATCIFCGDEEVCEILEVWGHEFQLDTCCMARHELFCEEANASPEAASALLRAMDVEALCGNDLRRVADGGCGGMVLDWKPEIRGIRRNDAKDFVREHHEHCPPPAGDRFRAAIWNGATLLGVCIVGRPVARMLPQDTWVEVNRLCIRRDVPAPLRWNACSQLYGWAAREAKRRGFERVITYTLEEEEGTTLRAAGWTDEGLFGRPGRSWNTPSRPRAEGITPKVRKRRWTRLLVRQRRPQAICAAGPLPLAA